MQCWRCGGRGEVIQPREARCPVCEGAGKTGPHVAHAACSCGRKVPMDRVEGVEDAWQLPACEECCSQCAPKVDIEVGHTGTVEIDGERVERTMPVDANKHDPTTPDAERPCDSCGDPIGACTHWKAYYHVGCLPPKDWREQMHVAWNRADTQGIRAKEAEAKVEELRTANRRLASQAAHALAIVDEERYVAADEWDSAKEWEEVAMWAVRKWLMVEEGGDE